jgi:hypothetical protein
MPSEHILSLLIQERDRLSRAIEALQGITPHQGRPRKEATASLIAAIHPLAAPVRTKRTFTAAQRKAQGARMKAYWAAKKKAA